MPALHVQIPQVTSDSSESERIFDSVASSGRKVSFQAGNPEAESRNRVNLVRASKKDMKKFKITGKMTSTLLKSVQIEPDRITSAHPNAVRVLAWGTAHVDLHFRDVDENGNYISGYGNTLPLNSITSSKPGESLQKEAAILLSCRHPNILQMIGTVKLAGNRTALVMDRTWGTAQLALKQNALSRRVAINVAAQVASAQQYLHSIHIQHGAIRTASVALLNDPQDEKSVVTAKLINFRYAKPDPMASETDILRFVVFVCNLFVMNYSRDAVLDKIDSEWQPSICRERVTEFQSECSELGDFLLSIFNEPMNDSWSTVAVQFEAWVRKPPEEITGTLLVGQATGRSQSQLEHGQSPAVTIPLDERSPRSMPSVLDSVLDTSSSSSSKK